MIPIGLYIHIPFCKRKCMYCDFCSYPGIENNTVRYIECLKKEMVRWSKIIKNEFLIKTVFIGGGTPTYLKADLIKEIMESCYKCFNVSEDTEITIEANPGTVDGAKLKILAEAGINRISFGVQAYQNRLLKELGRIHDFSRFKSNYLSAREAGFNNINIDIMFGLPDQTIHDWNDTLKQIIRLKPEHISCYGLQIEEGTHFYEMYKKGMLNLPDEDTERKMYWCASDIFQDFGYVHYEISNFAIPDRKCRHNINYWKNGRYLGIGCASHSNLFGHRFSNINNIFDYMEKIECNESIINENNRISEQESKFETIMLGLRLINGLNIEEYNNRYDVSFENEYSNELNELINLNLLRIENGYVVMTHKGLDIQDEILLRFMKY